jgi:hypothetical protein
MSFYPVQLSPIRKYIGNHFTVTMTAMLMKPGYSSILRKPITVYELKGVTEGMVATFLKTVIYVIKQQLHTFS